MSPMLPPWVPLRTLSQFSSAVWPAIAKIYTKIHLYTVFSTFFSLNIHFRCLNIYFFQDKMFHGSNPNISWNKTDIGAFFIRISQIFTECENNCFTLKVKHIVLL